jgi:hypothetical protein
MRQFDPNYAYLDFSLLLFAVSAGLAIALPNRRRTLVMAGLLAAPAGALDVFFIPAYWNPTTILGTRVGPEDFIFSYAVGSLSCLLAFGRTLHDRVLPRPAVFAWRRYAATVLGFTSWLAASTTAGLAVMPAAIAGMTAIGSYLSWQRREVALAGMRGAVGFGSLYLGALLLACACWPQLAGEWAGVESSGARLLGVPSGELVWAVVYGWTYPAFFSSVAWVRQPAIRAWPGGARHGYGLVPDPGPEHFR